MRQSVCGAFVLCVFSACGDGEPRVETPYQLRQALIIGDDEDGRLTEVDEDCDDAECEAVLERCGEDAYADVALDEEGEVADVLCYRGNVTVVELGEDAVETAEAGNNTVLVFDAVDDGPDVTGDVVLSGNNAIVYGEGADVSVIGGSLAIEKNNAIVRGVTILGDVTIDKNNTQLSFVVIEGNLTVNSNNVTLVESTVHGSVTIVGNNAVLVENQLAGVDALSAKNLTCNGNVRFDDADDDGEVEDSELGAEISCDAQTGTDDAP
jgi:hypothetical protein